MLNSISFRVLAFKYHNYIVEFGWIFSFEIVLNRNIRKKIFVLSRFHEIHCLTIK